MPRLNAEEARNARLAPEQRIGVPLAGNAQIPARFRFLELDPGGAQTLHADAVVVEEPGCERDGGLPGEDGGLLAGGEPVFVAADPQGGFLPFKAHEVVGRGLSRREGAAQRGVETELEGHRAAVLVLDAADGHDGIPLQPVGGLERKLPRPEGEGLSVPAEAEGEEIRPRGGQHMLHIAGEAVGPRLIAAAALLKIVVPHAAAPGEAERRVPPPDRRVRAPQQLAGPARLAQRAELRAVCVGFKGQTAVFNLMSH